MEFLLEGGGIGEIRDALGYCLPGDRFSDGESDFAGVGDGRQQGGSWVSCGGESDASVLAAAMIMLSVTRRAREARMPRARPGNM